MRLLAFVLAFALAVVATPGRALAAAAVVPIPDLVAFDATRDGSEVLIEGEAIGAALRSDQGRRFVNVLQDGVAVGVWMAPEHVALIDGFGDYHVVGTQLAVEGQVNIACSQHGGDFDVHAASVRGLAPSAPRVAEPLGGKPLVAAAVSLAALAQYAIYRRLRRRGIIL